MKKPVCFKLISILLAVTFLFVLGGCGKTQEGTQSDSASAVTTAATTPAVSYDPFGKYEPGIVLTSVHASGANDKFKEGEDSENNVYTRDIEENLGIKVKYNWIVDSTEYANKMNITIASSDIPDFFQVDNATFKNLLDSDMITDLSDVYAKYASPKMQEYSNAFIEGFEQDKVNGKLMALPSLGGGLIDIADVLWIRDDWMQKYKLSAPKTMDDLVNIAQTFMANIPGSYGIAINKDLSGGLGDLTPIANAFHAYTVWIKDASDQITYGSIQPEMKTALKFCNDLYNKGVISKEFAIKDANQVCEDILSDKVGISFGASWNSWWPYTDAIKKDPNAVWKPYPVPSTDDKPVGLQGSWPITSHYVVSTKCKYPEAIIKMANLSVRNTEEAKFTDRSVTGEISPTVQPVWYMNPASTYNSHVNEAEAVKTGDASKLTPAEKADYTDMMKWVNDKSADGYGAYFQSSSEGSFAVLRNYVDENNIVLSQIRGPIPQELATKWATLNTLEADAFTRIIMGASPIDEFDKFVADWKAAGGDAGIKEMNEVYNKK